MSSMIKTSSDAKGSVATILIISVLAVGLIGAFVFAAWAYAGKQDYKNNVESKIAVAVQDNTKKVQAEDAIKFAEELKNPFKTYIGPEAYGTISITYPKTWSSYVVNGEGINPVDFYAHPDIVPAVNAETSNFALRVQVVEQKYSTVMQQYSGQQKQGKLTVKPYVLPKVPGVTGARLDGQLTQKKQGSLVILPMRDKTLKIWTESSASLADFNDKVLPNASFER